jgi:hypothetical protein
VKCTAGTGSVLLLQKSSTNEALHALLEPWRLENPRETYGNHGEMVIEMMETYGNMVILWIS